MKLRTKKLQVSYQHAKLFFVKMRWVGRYFGLRFSTHENLATKMTSISRHRPLFLQAIYQL